MIQLSRLNGGVIAINPDLVTWIEVTPDTTIEFLNGDRMMVRESLDEVMTRVVEFRRAVRTPLGDTDAHPPSRAAIDSLPKDERGKSSYRPVAPLGRHG